jgi:urease accessory protein
MARVAFRESQFRDTGAQLPSDGDCNDAEVPPKYEGADIKNDLHISSHIFYLLTDSALPLGSFAYSSGLESFQEHHKHVRQQPESGKESKSAMQMALLDKFLCLSIEAVAFANIPYLLSAFRNPASLQMLDNDLDASTPCQVASRASRAQGGALLMLWKKSLATAPFPRSAQCLEGAKALNDFASNLATCYGHFAPLWGVICLATGQNIEQAAYVFLLNHARAVLSAALRTKASVIGQFHQYAVLGGAHLLPGGQTLHQLVRGCLSKVWNHEPQEACQVVPSMDLWIGRHDLLYTRVFNS